MKGISLKSIFFLFRKQIILTYFLFTVEFLLYLLGPIALGYAIDRFVKGHFDGLYLFASQHLLHLFISRARRLYDSRLYNRIYNQIATLVISEQKLKNVANTVVIARANLTRDLISFFERDITTIFNTLYSVVGSLFILYLYDYMLLLFCIALLLPSCLLNIYFNRKFTRLYRLKNSELERQVYVLGSQPVTAISEHLKRISRWDIKISDIGALNFTIMEFFVLALLIGSLMQFCHSHANSSSGTILAVFQYLLRFVTGLDNIPLLNIQVANLKDIQRRLEST